MGCEGRSEGGRLFVYDVVGLCVPACSCSRVASLSRTNSSLASSGSVWRCVWTCATERSATQ